MAATAMPEVNHHPISVACPHLIRALGTTISFSRLLNASFAASYGAACLDGSPPGYWALHMNSSSPGWIVHLQGGGWCWDPTDCSNRAKGDLGSSSGHNHPPMGLTRSGQITRTAMVVDATAFSALTVGKPSAVFVGYCDGGSFTGDNSSAGALQFRGRPNLLAVTHELAYSLGMQHADSVILTGSSAGGLAALLGVDAVTAALPSGIRLVAVPDAGSFLDLAL
eukprot:gene4422-4676_t